STGAPPPPLLLSTCTFFATAFKSAAAAAFSASPLREEGRRPGRLSTIIIAYHHVKIIYSGPRKTYNKDGTPLDFLALIWRVAWFPKCGLQRLNEEEEKRGELQLLVF
ncbi:hypothetical protein TYRP_009430, partial [Tyrophagus putrescentiae]